jgi:hypothetical protein
MPQNASIRIVDIMYAYLHLPIVYHLDFRQGFAYLVLVLVLRRSRVIGDYGGYRRLIAYYAVFES